MSHGTQALHGREHSIHFFVPGTPRPGGSKRAFTNKKTGKAMIVDACKKNPEWRADVKDFAMRVHTGALLDGPLYLEVIFYVQRPKGHFGSGKNASVLKQGAPVFPTPKPDCTKLVRALEDALTGVVWKDDAQIVTQLIKKRYVSTAETEDGSLRVGASVLIESY
jgi:Holliday junction resolvase RusA-like endonuclease